MSRVKQRRQLAVSYLLEMAGPNESLLSTAMRVAPFPPETWIGRGPRGGHYLALGERRRYASQDHEDDFLRNLVSVIDESHGARYLRPARARALLERAAAFDRILAVRAAALDRRSG